jgi:antitoxin ParD1/3/4/toxin ParE1/3/4
MSAPFQLTPQATEDLDGIWWFIEEGSGEAADRVEAEIIATCRRLAEYPFIGHKRRDITPLPVLFWTVPTYPNYIIVYRPQIKPLQVGAILHSKPDAPARRKSGNDTRFVHRLAKLIDTVATASSARPASRARTGRRPAPDHSPVTRPETLALMIIRIW